MMKPRCERHRDCVHRGEHPVCFDAMARRLPEKRGARILMDVDGVLADFIGPAIELINLLLGTSFVREDVDQWNYDKALKLTSAQSKQVYEAMAHPGWCYEQPVIPGSREAVEKLRGFGEVIAVTAPMRGRTWGGERTEWLMDHLGFKRSEVVITSAKHLVRGDCLIDDRAENVIGWKAEHLGHAALLWDTPHNRRDSYGWRVKSWSEVFELFEP